MNGRDDDLDLLRIALRQNAGSVAEALLGPRNRAASTPARWHFGRKGGSLWVHVAGPRSGSWHDGATGEGGDPLRLVQQTLGVDFPGAVAWARRWLRLPATERPAPPPRDAAPADAEQADQRLFERAMQCWREAQDPRGTLAETYLRSRGLALPECPHIRFHPRCRRGSTERLPAMVALLIDGLSGEPRGIHRTFLRPDGAGKAEGRAKLMLGGSGIVRLVDDQDVGVALGIAEGIETSLAVMQLAGWRPVWSCGSAGGIAGFPVLPGIETLTIFADPGEAGEEAAVKCAARWAEAGREVEILLPPELAGKPDADWLDVLVARVRAKKSEPV